MCPPRFKHVLFVHEPLKGDNVEIEGVDQHHAINLRAAPFWLNTTTVFEYGSGNKLKTLGGALRCGRALRAGRPGHQAVLDASRNSERRAPDGFAASSRLFL